MYTGISEESYVPIEESPSFARLVGAVDAGDSVEHARRITAPAGLANGAILTGFSNLRSASVSIKKQGYSYAREHVCVRVEQCTENAINRELFYGANIEIIA